MKVTSNFTRAKFIAAVRKSKEYIRAGDIFQVAISQRFAAKTDADPFEIYRALRVVNPSPYMYFLKLNDLAVVGSSPEMLVKVQGRDAFYRPIAGTRARGAMKRKTPHWKPNWPPIRRSAPSTSCWSTWAATIWAAFRNTVR